jgi:hypothetical protein
LDFHLGSAPWDLTRKRSQVQTLSRPLLFSLVKDLSAPSGQRSSCAAAAPRPQAAPPPNRMGPLELDATGPPSPNDHAAWSPPLGSGSWSAPRRRPAQDALRLPVSTCSVPYSPATRPAPWPEPAPVSARWDQGGTAAGTAAKRRPWATSSPRASQPRPTPHHPLPVRTDAGRRPRRPRTTAARRPLRPAGAARHTEPLRGPARGQRGGSAADTGGLSVRTPGCPGRLDTGRVDAGRPLDRLDGHPHGGPDEADRATTGLAGVRTSSRPATPRWAARPRPGHGDWGRSATHDGSAVTAPAPRP